MLTGKQDFGVIAALRRHQPDLVLAAEPDADSEYFATVDEPFRLPPDDLFGAVDLTRFADDQIEAGASFALLPTGHIRVGDTDSAKAAVEQANELDRDDVVVRLPFDATAMRTHHEQIGAIIRRSRHPVALSLFAQQDPLEGRGVANHVRELTTEVPGWLLWRTDLSAFAHLVEGGLAASVGFAPSLRHGLAPGKRGRRINRADQRPHVVLYDHFRYMRVSELQKRHASTPPPRCSDPMCNGQALDRFTGSDEDRLAAHEHNVHALLRLAGELISADDKRLDWWRAKLVRAGQAHEESERQTKQHWPLPPVVETWRKQQGVDS